MWNIISFLSGIGIGAIVSTILTIWHTRKAKIFDTKLIAYNELIAAFQEAVIESNEHVMCDN